MRLRTFATAAILGVTLLPPSLAAATSPANVTVERAQLRALMTQRRALVEQLAAADGPRGQLLTLHGLVAADAILSADAAALRRTIQRLSPRPAAHRQASGRVVRHAPANDTTLLVAAPGVLWSPSARVIATGLPPGDASTAPSASAPVSSARPFTLSRMPAAYVTTPLLGTSTVPLDTLPALGARRSILAPAASPTPMPRATAHATATPSTIVRVASRRRTSTRTAHASRTEPTVRVSQVPLAPSDAPAHGRLMLQGADGALSLATANARVAAALLIPLPVAYSQSSASSRATTTRPRDPRAGLPALMQRWRVVTRALASVRALEAWTRANAPTPVMTANDVVASPDILHQRLDRWSARPSADALAATRPFSPTQQSAVPSSVLGVTLTLTSPATTTTALGEAISGTIATSGTTPLVASGIADSPISTTAPVSLTQDAVSGGAMSPTTPVSSAIASAPSIVDAPISLTTEAALTADISLSSTAAATPTLPALDGTPTSTDVQVTPASSVTSSASLTATTSAAISATVPLTDAVLGNGAPSLVGGARLALAVEDGSPVLTVSSAPATDPLSLTVTLPTTATDALAPAGFSSARGALESVLRQGQALYADLKAKSAGVEADYRARLSGVVALNAQMERNYYARYYAWQRSNRASATYTTRSIAFSAFLQRRQAAKAAHALWLQRTAAWAEYARELKSYNDAVAAQGQASAAPISGTTDVSATAPASTGAPLPPRPVAPVWPGPEPAPFTEAMPPFPVPAGPAAPNPGLEPMGYALPTPPDAVPSWDGASLPVSLSLVSYGGIAQGVNAAGYQHMTQDQVLSAGALDGVPSYIDPIKGIITTRFGGSTIFQAFHPGLDIANAKYTPIHAAAAGVVVWAGLAVPGDDHGSYGNCVIIKHNDHISTLYAHMDDQIHPLEVRVGDMVQQGQVIGYEGMTGWTTGPHLHFEVRVDNIQVNPLLLIPNPES